MITIIKETPITIDGVDYLEQLVKDNECWGIECCEKCYYRGWSLTEDGDYDCCTVHGCTTNPQTYFRITKL